MRVTGECAVRNHTTLHTYFQWAAFTDWSQTNLGGYKSIEIHAGPVEELIKYGGCRELMMRFAQGGRRLPADVSAVLITCDT